MLGGFLLKKNKLSRCLLMILFAGILSLSWLFPQSLFRDCIHVVFQADGTDNPLSEEDYLDLFHLQKSEIKISWKILPIPQ